MRKIYVVTSEGDVMGAFTSRREAALFIVDELAMALQFGYDGEAAELEAELMEHGAASNAYEYDYRITECELND